MNLDTYGIANGYNHTFGSFDDILRKYNDSNGIIVRSFSKQRTLNIIKSICENGKTVCPIGNGGKSKKNL